MYFYVLSYSLAVLNLLILFLRNALNCSKSRRKKVYVVQSMLRRHALLDIFKTQNYLLNILLEFLSVVSFKRKIICVT